MNYSIISFLLIVVPLAVIIVIIVRKFPQLSLLDVENLPEVKAGKKKEEVLRKRAEARAAQKRYQWLQKLQPMAHKLKGIQKKFRTYVGTIERRVVRERQKSIEEGAREVKGAKKESARTMVQQAEHFRQLNDLEAAEKKYLSVIKLDPKNVDAYRGLGSVYMKQEQWPEAKETFQFVLQLDPGNADACVRLATIAEAEGDIKAAIGYYEQAIQLDDQSAVWFGSLADLLAKIEQYDTALEAITQAVDLEPQNPKYLDMLTEISILGGHKDRAEEALQQLRMVNPENQKLAVFRERIDRLG